MEVARVNKPPLSRILEIADRLFPLQEAEPWDNAGIQIGDPQRLISGITFSLDATPESVCFAAERSCQLLITHHPVIIDPLRTIQPDNLAGKTLLSAARSGVDILSLHTNLDAASGGLNDYLARKLGLTEIIIPLPARCARLGRLPQPMTVTDLTAMVARKLEVTHLRVIAQGNAALERVFLASGSGMSYLPEAVRQGADAMITGDVRYHAAREAMELGMPLIDAGHYGLEKFAVQVLMEAFTAEFSRLALDVDCLACNVEGDPFLNIYHREEDSNLERTTAAP